MNPQRLREATAAEHLATEDHMPLMSATLTRATYIATLAHIYPLVAGWEAWASAHCPRHLREMMDGRGRTAMLAADLDCLGVEPLPAASFDPASIPGLQGEGEGADAAFLGALYVMEGSTLGGQHLARHLEPLLDLASCGTKFFRGYGDRTGSRWKEFQAAVEACPETGDEAMILAARAMFGVFASAILPVSPARNRP